MRTYTLTLHRLQFFGRHGVYAHETERGQTFIVTAEIDVPLPEGPGVDQLSSVIDYTQAQALIGRIVEGDARRLIETVADDVAAALLGHFPSASRVVIDLLKPEPPVTFAFEGVSVRIERRRGQ
jgi:dihydroneopterin aldolase